MRTIRLRRVAVLFAAAFGLLASMAPPAQAATAATFVFQGEATLGGGLSYPCVGAQTVDPTKCSTLVVDPNAPKPATVQNGNTRTVDQFSTINCAASGVYQLEPVDPSSLCSVTNVGAGTVTGSCGLSSGLITVSVAFLVSRDTQSIAVLLILTVHWVAVGGTLVITGKSDTGDDVVGEVTAVPSGAPVVTDNSCANKSAREFDISGTASLITLVSS